MGLSNVARPLAAAPLAPSETLLSVPAGEPDTTVAQLTPLAAFLSHASLEAGDNQAGEGTDAVQLMTVHSAKGLEFQVVFITGLEEGLFPHENAIAEPDGLEEERRLMYVAITRARTRLYLSLSQTRMLHGQTRYNLRSRFLDELPGQALKWLTPRTRYGGGPGRSSGAFLDHRENEYSGRTWASASGNRIADAGAGAGKAVGQGFDRGVAWRVGQSVAHPRFGEGVILELEGWGEDARARINFGPQGIKVLSLQIAKLQARD